MHIVSDVKGRMQPDKDEFDLLRSAFPHGTVSGAPKVRAMEIIDEQEPTRRGFYAGCAGYFSYSGDMDMAISAPHDDDERRHRLPASGRRIGRGFRSCHRVS